MTRITVVGAGLAGSECALQLANLGYDVDLYEMRSKVMTPAHKTPHFGELVCSNSFGSLSESSAPQQLKWEAESFNSYVLSSAKANAVPAGQALGVDRDRFAQSLTEKILAHEKIKIHNDVVTDLEQVARPCVIATGPLTHEALAQSMQTHFGDDFLYFFDAIAPIIDFDSINMDIAWKADRYDKGTADYINCPMNKEEYNNFIDAIEGSKKIEPKNFETTEYFEGCMPIEEMVARGRQTPRFGPMKPVGLVNPRTGREAFAVVQLRQDNKEGTAFNIVGFQTRMAYGEQTRVFRMIPGLENAEFLKLGSIHRNLFINSPKRLNRDLSSQKDPLLFFAGQISGVEGYFESTCTGILVAQFLHRKLSGLPWSPPPRFSAMGSLLEAITDPSRIDNFQPTNINFGLLPSLDLAESEALGKRNKWGQLKIEKNIKKQKQIEKARQSFLQWRNS